MFDTIKSKDLLHISGGQAPCPRYEANADVLAQRAHMSRTQRQAADAQWKKTVSHLSSSRLAEVQKQAVLNANHGACAVTEPLIKDQLSTLRFK